MIATAHIFWVFISRAGCEVDVVDVFVARSVHLGDCRHRVVAVLVSHATTGQEELGRGGCSALARGISDVADEPPVVLRPECRRWSVIFHLLPSLRVLVGWRPVIILPQIDQFRSLLIFLK